MNDSAPSRYAELSRLATLRTLRVFEHKSLCRQIAIELRAALVDYLGAPQTAITFRNLDTDCCFTDPRETSDGTPLLRRGRDNRWYFALCIHLETDDSPAYGMASFKFGVSLGADGCQELELDRKWQINAGDPTSYGPLVEFVYADLENDCKKPDGVSPSRIGF